MGRSQQSPTSFSDTPLCTSPMKKKFKSRHKRDTGVLRPVLGPPETQRPHPLTEHDILCMTSFDPTFSEGPSFPTFTSGLCLAPIFASPQILDFKTSCGEKPDPVTPKRQGRPPALCPFLSGSLSKSYDCELLYWTCSFSCLIYSSKISAPPTHHSSILSFFKDHEDGCFEALVREWRNSKLTASHL